jgi:hypothetical protein
MWPCLVCRRKVLSKWKVKKGSEATYMKLLRIFVTARHSKCAEVLCDVLKGRTTALTQGMDAISSISYSLLIKQILVGLSGSKQ